MNDSQKNLLALLVEFDELCHSHDITYYLGGGTALGAVRHRGFLFWDDDIDIYITRKNWEKLRMLAEKILPDNRALIYSGNTPYYLNVIPRYVNQMTSQFYRSQIICGQSCGQHLELLIMDPLPVETEEINNYKKLLLVYTEMFSPYFVVNKQMANKDSLFDEKLYYKYYRLSKILGRTRVIKMLEDKLLCYSDDECITYCMRWGIVLYLYNKSSFGKQRYESFEGYKLPVAEHAEEILRTAYGDDWMYIPIGAGQVVHNAIFRDYDTSLKVYCEDYMPYINRKKALKTYKNYKKINLRTWRKKEQANRAIYELQALTIRLELQFLHKQKQQLEQLFLQERYMELKAAFDRYYQEQLTNNMLKNRILILQDLHLIYLAATALVYTGMYYNAAKLLTLLKSLEMELSPELKELDKLISLLRELSVAVYDHNDVVLTQNLINAGQERYGLLLDFCRYQLWVELQNIESTCIESWQQLQDKALQVLTHFPDDPECLKYLADGLWGEGKQKQAMEIYKIVMQNSRNGILHLDITDKTGMSFMDLDEENDNN